MARKRDYKAEYRRRINLNVYERGLTVQQARGRHADEGVRMPDGRKHVRISVQEVTRGFLRADTVEDLHRVNVGLRGPDAAKWRAFALRMGWQVYASKKGFLYTQNDVPSELIARMEYSERRYFFGY